MDLLQNILLVLHIVIAVLLVLLVLLQPNNGDGGFTSSSTISTNSLMSGRAQANILTKITIFLAALFMINSLVLAFIAFHKTGGTASKIEQYISTSSEEKVGQEDKSLTNQKPEDKKVELPLAE